MAEREVAKEGMAVAPEGRRYIELGPSPVDANIKSKLIRLGPGTETSEDLASRYSGRALYAFDVDGTLSYPTMPLEQRMARLIAGLLEHSKVAIITGKSYDELNSLFLGQIRDAVKERGNEDLLSNLILATADGSAMYTFSNGVASPVYSETLSNYEKARIKSAIEYAYNDCKFEKTEVYGEQIIDKGTSITFCGPGTLAPPGVPEKWDARVEKRSDMAIRIREKLGDAFDVIIAGRSSIDVVRKGVNKGSAILRVQKITGYGNGDMLYVGDAFAPGHNDYAVLTTGVDAIQVASPAFTEGLIAGISRRMGNGAMLRGA